MFVKFMGPYCWMQMSYRIVVCFKLQTIPVSGQQSVDSVLVTAETFGNSSKEFD
jgi:hypothetical protein